MPTIIDKYRATHKRLRKYLDTYTKKLCPECPDPCCRKPTKVSEFDVLIANACGCALQSANRSAEELVEAGMLALRGNSEAGGCLEPCDYLGDDGCIFPDDLRPYECTRWICSFLKKEVKPSDMREIRALLHKLMVIHRDLLAAIKPKR